MATIYTFEGLSEGLCFTLLSSRILGGFIRFSAAAAAAVERTKETQWDELIVSGLSYSSTLEVQHYSV